MENNVENSSDNIEFDLGKATEGMTSALNSDPDEVKEEINDVEETVVETGKEVTTEDSTSEEENNEENLETKEEVQEEIIEQNDDDNPWMVIANEFKGSILDDEDFESEDFKFDGTKESFQEMLARKSERQAEQMVDEIIDSLPDKIRNPIKSYIEGLDPDSAFEISDKISKYENVTRESLTEDLDKAKEIYRESLLKKGFSKDKADKYVQRAEDLDELVDEALDASKDLVAQVAQEKEKKKQELALQAAEREKQQKERIEKLKSEIMDSQELFKGIPTTDIIKKKVYENMTKPVGTDANGKPLTKIQMLAQNNPAEFYKLLNTYEVLGLFDQDKNGKFIPKLDKLTTYKKSKSVDTGLSKAKAAAKLFKGGNTSHLNDVNSKSLKDNLDSIKKAFESAESN